MNRILFISHERKMGGANFALYELVQELKNTGNDVSVVVLYKGCPIDRELRKIGIKTFSCFFGWWQQPKDWPAALKWAFRLLHWLQWISVIRISKFVRRNHIQIIHSNSSVIDIGAQVAKQVGCKHVWHFREFGSADYQLEYMFSESEIRKYVCTHSDAIIFISNALRNAYLDINHNVNIIYDGVGIEHETRKDREIHTRDRSVCNFLVAGNINAGKNQLIVLKAVTILIHELKVSPDRFHVYFAGAVTALRKSRQYMIELENYITNNDLKKNVTFLGFVNDMERLREKIDIAIVPSRCEAYGRVTLEAMLEGELVIASNSGSNPELIGKDERGLLFKDNDAYDLAQKMRLSIENEFFDLIENAKKYVKLVHDRELACEKVQRVYCEVLKER